MNTLLIKDKNQQLALPLMWPVSTLENEKDILLSNDLNELERVRAGEDFT